MKVKVEKLSSLQENYELGFNVEFLLDVIARYDSSLEIQIKFVESTHFSKEVKEEAINQLKGRSIECQ